MKYALVISFLLFAGQTAAQSSKPTGQPMSLAVLMVMGVVLFAVFRILDYIKRKEPPPEPPPMPKAAPPPMPAPAARPPASKPLEQQITETFGDLKEVGKHTYFTGGILGKGGDNERYVAFAKINKGYIRDEERSKANANYELYRDRIKYLRIALALMAALVLIVSLEFFYIVYQAIKSLLS